MLHLRSTYVNAFCITLLSLILPFTLDTHKTEHLLAEFTRTKLIQYFKIN